MRAAIPALSEKLPKWHLFNPCKEFDFFLSAMKVPFNDFIQNMSQAPSKCLSEPKSRDKFDYLKNPSKDFNFFMVPINS